MYTLRPYQSEAKKAILTEWDKGQRKTLLVLPTGCHAVGERLLMADGTSRSVENIAVGDKLLGADGKPRLVLRRHTGYDLLYRITPDSGEPFIVTGDHKLTLVRNDKLTDVTVMEWLSWDEIKRSKYMLIRSGCISEFPDADNEPLRVFPYFMGILLSDKRFDSLKNGSRNSHLFTQIKYYGLAHSSNTTKQIPQQYKTATLPQRLELIAGLLDQDGYVADDSFYFKTHSPLLAIDMAFMCRSVGLAANITGCYQGKDRFFRLHIYGDCSILPCRVTHHKYCFKNGSKSALRSRFTVMPSYKGDYIGFTVDGDNRYLLHDFTITHNCGKTVVFSAVTENQVNLGHRVLIMAHRGELLDQAADKLKAATGIDSALEKADSTSLYSLMPVTVGSVQSMAQPKRLGQFPQDYFQDIIVDEAHHCLSDTYQRVLEHFPQANILGVTATPDRGDMQNLGGYFDSKAYEYSMIQAIRDGYLCPIKAQMIPLKLDIQNVGIEYDGDGGFNGFDQTPWSPSDDLITYLETLFDKDDIVGYVTNDVWQDGDGKWKPSKGVYHRTAAELIKSLRKYKDDIGATVGDFNPQAGAWIRFNPLDGQGVRNENVTAFRYALVESDTIPIAEQDAVFRKLELPIAVLVHSGGKSIHAIVHVDADSSEEYRKRVSFLYDFLEKNGVTIDRQNRNPSRLSRMPGVTRNGNRQYLIATNIGRKSWVDWLDFVEGVSDELPDMVTLDTYKNDPPPLPDELISGILRCGHKMLISGSSKAGKSFLLMELCISIAEGKKWLGFDCKKGRVLYVNLEIDPASAINRFLKIYTALGWKPDNAENIIVWNLRGHAVPLNELVPKLVRRVKDQHLTAIVIDPIYKVIMGDENNASDMGAFCNQFDKICMETGCSVIYCHHHSKGAQGAKKAMDRASGSGVFARDPDAQLDMIELELSEDIKNFVRDGYATGWRLESSLREFPNIKPINFWFEYPIHKLDISGELGDSPAQGTPEAGRLRNGCSKTTKDAENEFRKAFDILNFDGSVKVTDIIDYLNLSDKTVYRRLRSMRDEFRLEKGRVYRCDNAQKTDS